MVDAIEQRRQAFLRAQHRRAVRVRQHVTWLGNVSYTVGAVALGDLLFAHPRHMAGELIFGAASAVTLGLSFVLAPLGEVR